MTLTGDKTMTKKVHWTQTPEGRQRMSDIQKLSRKKIREAKATRKYTKRVKRGITVLIGGKDARKALNELISNAQYDKLDVTIMIAREK
jgi:hypothetical protein